MSADNFLQIVKDECFGRDRYAVIERKMSENDYDECPANIAYRTILAEYPTEDEAWSFIEKMYDDDFLFYEYGPNLVERKR